MREGQARPETVASSLLSPLSPCLSAVFRREGMISFSFPSLSPFLFFSFSFVLHLSFPFVSALERRRPYFGWQQSVVEETGYLENPTTAA